MMKQILFILLAIFSIAASGSDLKTNYLQLYDDSRPLNVRVGVQNPSGTAIGDILYVHL